jgi:hypothetical protein
MTAIADERAGGWILSAEQPIVEFHEGSRRHDARLLAQEPPQLVADTKPLRHVPASRAGAPAARAQAAPDDPARPQYARLF